ncbi:cupin domain-containing protein [Winogradskyella arenosi]|uniref:Cupin domain n=1 Tax=Winogradskyella arenosi TaxID=533325 RepID=A0A368ZNC4_9FLAO|nr:cupin domain-containing protein [Winogradskyella arenosi]RCW93433.1 cupin domain [Winogradskyella arenosi]
MNRNDFIKSTALSIGALATLPIMSSQEKLANQSTNTASPLQKQTPKIVKHKEGLLLNVLGDQQNIKLTAKDTNGQYTLIVQYNDPGIGIPAHVHDNEDEVFQVLEGEVAMSIGEKTSTLTAGDLIFCPRGIPHSWKVIGDQKAKAILSIFPAGLEQMFMALAELPPGPPNMELVSKICAQHGVHFV